ncbi:eukaryotic translation initiation factor 2D isoform X2 [Phalacrocorax aristotelis]|uniref:eukaryotic translation initiation factor 2D isoform X2 n=1 Tax=Phalacrocorax aristotelis TaxID=126867 RepID=UPI003F4CAB35
MAPCATETSRRSRSDAARSCSAIFWLASSRAGHTLCCHPLGKQSSGSSCGCHDVHCGDAGCWDEGEGLCCVAHLHGSALGQLCQPQPNKQVVLHLDSTSLLSFKLRFRWRTEFMEEAPSVTDSAEKESAEDEEEMEGKEPVIGFSTDPLQHVDVGGLSLKERDSCAVVMGKEELNESRAVETAEGANTEVQQEAEDSRSPQEQMDALFNQCFLHALKCKVKKSDLPLLTSTFLRSHMFPCCPAGQQLDIKKSSYKKFSKFLQCMQHQKILQVKELNKGVESIVEVDWKHPDIKAFTVPEGFSSASAAPDSKSEDREQVYHAPEIIPLYGVSTKMIPLFQESGHRKGSILSSSEVRNIVINYVKTNELVDETNKNFVKVNAILCDCLLDKSEQDEITNLRWDDLLSRCLERLQPLHQVTFFGQEPVVRKGNIEPIDITIAQRSSNKKVTIIKNLELYGLDPQRVANILQQKVQASATITPVPGTKDRVQVQIQGNQIHHLAKMLLEEYQLPRKYIQGLEKAPKLGRKK